MSVGLLYAQTPNSLDIRVGDIILIDLDCYICQIIKEETQSKYSHSGLVIGHENGKPLVAQSLGEIEVVTLQIFLKSRRPGTPVNLKRSKELDSLFFSNMDEYRSRTQLLQYFYFNKYSQNPFDRLFLWDNYNENGVELLYCSEFIVKIMNEILTYKLQTEAMSFNKHSEFWETYYGDIPVPEGQPGSSPGSLDRDPLLRSVPHVDLLDF